MTSSNTQNTPSGRDFHALSNPLSTPKETVQCEAHTYLDNRATTAQRQQPTTRNRRPASQRLSERDKTKVLLVGLLSTVDRDLGEKIRNCGSRFAVKTCGKHIISRQPLNRCDHRLCPYCASRKSRLKMKKYLPIVLAFIKHSPVPVTLCHLVLTLTYIDGETAKEAKKRLYNAFKKLIRRDFWNEHFAGGLYSIEQTISEANLTQKAGMWHCHLHALVFRKKFFDIAELRNEWLTATGDSNVLRLDKVTEVKSGMIEVLKYVTKPSDLKNYTPDHVSQLLKMKGEKMFGAFGEFAKFAKDYTASDNDNEELIERFDYAEGDCCPHCEEPLFTVVLSVAETIGFYKRLEQMPINLPKITKKE
jgi:hypothetical protein